MLALVDTPTDTQAVADAYLAILADKPDARTRWSRLVRQLRDQ